MNKKRRLLIFEGKFSPSHFSRSDLKNGMGIW